MKTKMYDAIGLQQVFIAAAQDGADKYRYALMQHVKTYGRRVGRSEYDRKKKEAKRELNSYYDDPFRRLYEVEEFFLSDYYARMTTVDGEWVLRRLAEEVRQKAIEEGIIMPNTQIVDWTKLVKVA